MKCCNEMKCCQIEKKIENLKKIEIVVKCFISFQFNEVSEVVKCQEIRNVKTFLAS